MFHTDLTKTSLRSGGFSFQHVSPSSCVSVSASICAGTCCASGNRCSCRRDAATASQRCWASMRRFTLPPTSVASQPGAIALGLQRRGLSLPRARLLVYFACCLLTACATLAAFLPAGLGLMAVLLLVGCGSLGLFPFFYALSQELSQRHQGKVIGVLGTSAWVALSVLHPLFGRYIDATGSFDLGLALIGWVPLVSWVVLWRFWPGSARLLPKPCRGGDIMIQPGLRVLVTGGASGIGWAIAIALQEQGARVHLCDASSERLAQALGQQPEMSGSCGRRCRRAAGRPRL